MPRLIALYLPQFHPIPENDEWWGKGFTEWTNAAKAKPLFRGHHQPNVPSELGFYDLRVPETRLAQAELARAYGIEGFCYYHYWFSGKKLLEKPLEVVVDSGEPRFPFCICWANETWTGIWHGAADRVLIEQTYSAADDIEHFRYLRQFFCDERYVRVDGKPLLLILKPWRMPSIRRFTDIWRDLAEQAGLGGLFIVGMQDPAYGPPDAGIDAFVVPNYGLPAGLGRWRFEPFNELAKRYRAASRKPLVFDYEKACLRVLANGMVNGQSFPCLLPNWDNTPRSGWRGLVLQGSSPELFRRQVREAIRLAYAHPPDRQLVFVKSWNEWAEGNYLEPDVRFGRGYLEVLAQELRRQASES